MKYELSEEKSCKRVFKVEMDAGECNQARERARVVVSGQVNLPGFRKGKVPSQVLESRFGKQVEEETIEELVGMGATRVLKETGLEPITSPSVSAITPGASGMSFLLTIELAPQIVLEEYQGLNLIRDAAIVRPEDVDAVIENVRRRFATFPDAGRPARWGDLAVVDYDGTINGAPFEGSQGRDVLVMIGRGEAMREIEDALAGRPAGDKFAVTVVYPADHANKDLAGKSANLAVTVKEVKAQKLPDLDDEFAKGAGDYKGLEDLRRAVRERLKAEKEREAISRLRATAVDRLLHSAPAEVTPSIIEEEMNYMAVRGAEELGKQGVRQVEQLRVDPKQFREMFRPAATRAVREAFVLEAVARKEGIMVGDEDIRKEIAASRPEGSDDPGKLAATLKSQGRWERLRHKLMQDRALDLVLSRAVVAVREIRL
jgi:trigger factor